MPSIPFNLPLSISCQRAAIAQRNTSRARTTHANRDRHAMQIRLERRTKKQTRNRLIGNRCAALSGRHTGVHNKHLEPKSTEIDLCGKITWRAIMFVRFLVQSKLWQVVLTAFCEWHVTLRPERLQIRCACPVCV